MKTLQYLQIEEKYNCFKERLNELKTMSSNDCECSRFTVCFLEAAQMTDYLFGEINTYNNALAAACDTAFCQDKDICEKECGDECVKAAMTKLLHIEQMDKANNNN